MTDTFKFPFYARLAFTLLTLILLFIIMYYGQGIIVPLLMAGLFAILLNPFSNFLRNRCKFPHVLAVLTTILLFILFFVGLILFLSWQITGMMDDWGKITRNVNVHINNLQSFVRDTLNVSKTEQSEMLNDATHELMSKWKDYLSSAGDVLLNLIVLPIYTFLILLYRTHFIKFLSKLFNKKHHDKLQEILMQIKVSVQSYIVGLFIEMIIVSALTSIGFMIIGVEYAILLGVITGILNLIPYVGILIAGLLSMAASLTGSSELTIVFGVIIVNIIVQFIDNNFLVPMIVSSKVEINALVSIVGIIVGGALAGVAGMFLAIPLIAIMKVIFDRIDGLSPWGYLMGDDIPKTFEWHKIRFPLYNTENTTSHTIIMGETESQEVVFTETTTQPEENDSPS